MWISREVWGRAVDPSLTESDSARRYWLNEWVTAETPSFVSAVFDGFPLEGMVGIDRDCEPPADGWLTATPAHYVEHTRWFALLRRSGHGSEERVEIPRPVVTELQRTNGGTAFRVHYGEPDPGARLAAEINAAAERVSQRYLDTPQRYVLSTDPLSAADVRRGQQLYARYTGTPDGASPDTSQPYFLDLIGRIDSITEEEA